MAECVVALLLLVPIWWCVQHWQQGQLQRAALVQQVHYAALQVALDGRVHAGPLATDRVSSVVGDAPGMAGTLMRSALTLIEPVAAVAPGSADLRSTGWTRVALHAPPPPGAFWRDHRGPWSESLTLYAGDWSLSRSRAVERRTQALLPTTPLEWAVATLEPLRSAIALLEPGFRSTCARRIDPDVLPADRLVTSVDRQPVAVPADGWRPRC
jgi:hypothetical protein